MFDTDKLYTKVVVLDKIYNFVVHKFFLFKVVLMPKYLIHKILYKLIPKESYAL
jgi:hypothetical protein